MAELIHATRADLITERDRIEQHIAHCCAAQNGTCDRLERLGEIQYLLGGTESGGKR